MATTLEFVRTRLALSRRQRWLVGVAVVVFVALGVGRWWWEQPNSSWACQPDDRSSGCLSTVQLEIEPPVYGSGSSPIRGELIYRMGADISNDGTRIAAVVHRFDSSNGRRLVASSVVVFDAASGRRLQTLLEREHPDEDDAPLKIVQARYSPDGTSLVVAAHPDLHVFDAESGDVQATFEADGCAMRFGVVIGVSKDNDQVQCELAIYDAATGRPVFDDLAWIEDSSSPLLANPGFVSRDRRLCEQPGFDEVADGWRSFLVPCDSTWDGVAGLARASAYGLGIDETFYTFDPTSRFALTGVRGEKRSRIQPRRATPETRFLVVDLVAGEPALTITTDRYDAGRAGWHEWSEQNGLLMLYTEAGAVSVHQIDRDAEPS